MPVAEGPGLQVDGACFPQCSHSGEQIAPCLVHHSFSPLASKTLMFFMLQFVRLFVFPQQNQCTTLLWNLLAWPQERTRHPLLRPFILPFPRYL